MALIEQAPVVQRILTMPRPAEGSTSTATGTRAVPVTSRHSRIKLEELFNSMPLGEAIASREEGVGAPRPSCSRRGFPFGIPASLAIIGRRQRHRKIPIRAVGGEEAAEG